MQFNLFPAAAKDRPLVRWKTECSKDPAKIAEWKAHFGDGIKHWCLPTGTVNGIIVLDVDMKGNGYETLKQLPAFPETKAQATPSGGRHYIFRLPTDGRHYGNRVKFLPGLDIRAEGGYIVYYGADERPIADAPSWLLDASLKADPDTSGVPASVSGEVAMRVVEEALTAIREAPAGESNNVLNVQSYRLGQLVAAGSVSRAYAEAGLLTAALERNKPRPEAIATIRSGIDGGLRHPLTSPFDNAPPQPVISIPPPPTIARWTPPRLTREAIMDTSKLRKPQLFEHWSTEDITLTTADGGTGKTTLAVYEAVCLALGERFLGFRCITPGRTLFITGEDTAEKIAAIIGQILRQLGLLDDPRYNEEVNRVLDSIVVKKDPDLCLVVKDRNGFLHPNMDALRKMLEAVEDIRPKLIVLDPISSFWGSEAALNDMAKAVTKLCAELVHQSGACVHLINHMGKVSSGQKDMTQFAGRGGTGLPSHARVSRALRPVFDDEYAELTGGATLGDKQSAMMCNVNKFSDGSPLYNKPFLIVRDGFLFARKALSEAKAREEEEKLSDIERVFGVIKEKRQENKFPNQNFLIAHFKACGDPLSAERVKRAVSILSIDGHMGEFVKSVANPDQVSGGKVFVITGSDGREQ
jgi:RecA-family ATPase